MDTATKPEALITITTGGYHLIRVMGKDQVKLGWEDEGSTHPQSLFGLKPFSPLNVDTHIGDDMIALRSSYTQYMLLCKHNLVNTSC